MASEKRDELFVDPMTGRPLDPPGPPERTRIGKVVAFLEQLARALGRAGDGGMPPPR